MGIGDGDMKNTNDTIHEARFLSLVLSLYNSAWIAMGKIASPVTGKVEKDLEAARGSIDLLETLKVKTKGNVSPEEERVLVNCLSTLQLNFVEESSRREEKPADKEAPAPRDEATKASPEGETPQG
jgi:ABC-type amino acid transport system permease subunit